MKLHNLIALLNTLDPELTVQCIERYTDEFNIQGETIYETFPRWKDLSPEDIKVKGDYLEIGDENI